MLPRTEWVDELDANARNWPHKIKIRRDLGYPMAVWSQEFFEARFKAFALATAALVTALATFTSPLLGFLSLAGFGVLHIPVVKRWVECRGHEIEVQAGEKFYGVYEEAYRRNEARVLTKYPQFEGWTAAEIEDRMLDHTGFAACFVNTYKKKIERHGNP